MHPYTYIHTSGVSGGAVDDVFWERVDQAFRAVPCPSSKRCFSYIFCILTIQTISFLLTFALIQGQTEVVILDPDSDVRHIRVRNSKLHLDLRSSGGGVDLEPTKRTLEAIPNNNGAHNFDDAIIQAWNATPTKDQIHKYARSFKHVMENLDTAADNPPLPLEKHKPMGLPRKQNTTVSIGNFLKIYKEYCQRTFTPFNTTLPLCPCLPPTLEGNLTLPQYPKPPEVLANSHLELHPGGYWKPRDCTPRHRVAIIVPYRDRADHKWMFLEHIHPLLQRQMLEYRIIIVEQHAPDTFNKAAMMNIGFIEAQTMGVFDCYIFHDVDMLAEDDRNMYTCAGTPRHVGVYIDKFNYTLLYRNMFGGATAFTSVQFRKVNGFSNRYYGWGGEDDDMSRRLLSRRYRKVRFPASVARYTMIKHEHDKNNPLNLKSPLAFKLRPRFYRKEGLNTLRYDVRKTEHTPLYTWILADIPPPSEKVELQDWDSKEQSRSRQLDVQDSIKEAYIKNKKASFDDVIDGEMRRMAEPVDADDIPEN